MRLWHIDLIPYLPRQQLLGQWRELNSIYKNQPNHILINFVYDYPKEDLYIYSTIIINEMYRRGYKVNLDNHNCYFKDIITKINIDKLINKSCFKKKMTNRYLAQCIYNLEEKYDCGGISKEEWLLPLFHNFKLRRNL